jgi:hypothetical protein
MTSLNVQCVLALDVRAATLITQGTRGVLAVDYGLEGGRIHIDGGSGPIRIVPSDKSGARFDGGGAGGLGALLRYALN